MPVDWLALSGWALLVLVLVAAAVLIGRFTARVFVRATGARGERR